MPELKPDQMPFSRILGLTITQTDKEKITAELIVSEELCTTGSIMHGGALMATADTLGAIGAYLNLPDGAKATTTIESKTNFMRAAPKGSKVYAETIPLHRGRRMSVWQTTLRNEDDKTLAIVTQSQLVL